MHRKRETKRHMRVLKTLKGAIAQLVEQRTENPCVPGSIPGGTTSTKVKSLIHNELAIFLLVTIAYSHYNSHYLNPSKSR